MDLPDVDKLYVTVIPARFGSGVKIHKNLAGAKSAVSSQKFRKYSPSTWNEGPSLSLIRQAKVYNIVDGQWNLVYDIPEGTPASELPWKV